MKTSHLFLACAAMILAAGGPAGASLLVNGNFETETPAGCPGATCSTPPPGWSGNAGVAVDDVFPNSGTYDVALGLFGGAPATLSQTVATTPGSGYTLSFFVQDQSGSPADIFTVSFGAFSATLTGDQVPGYVAETFSIAGANIGSASTTLTFTASNLFSDFNIDDVSLNVKAAAVPEAPALGLLLSGLAMLLGMRALTPDRAGGPRRFALALGQATGGE